MNSKRTIMILILVLTIGIVGLTIAYFSNSSTVNNIFTTQPYGTTVTETFTSPSNWLPGQEVDKTVVATNTGNVDEAVRISLSESWTTANGGTLNGWITENGNKSSHLEENEPSTDERVAIINFDNLSDWEYSNGYYYYKYKLSPNESTNSLIKSVTFNSKTKLDDTCVETQTATGRTITCNSSGDDYDHATYTLTFNIETVQYNKYQEAWNTDIAITSEHLLYCDAFEVGEIVKYNNDDYFVLKDSTTSDDYVTLLKKNPLTAEEVNTYSTDYISQDGEYPYYESDMCNENIQSGCSTNYDTSNVKEILDMWSNSFNDDLVSVDGYKIRIIGENDVSIFTEFTGSSTKYGVDDNNPSFIDETYFWYWTNIKLSDSNNKVFNIGNRPNRDQYIRFNNVYEKSYIRPIINLKKELINGACSFSTGCNINNYNHTSYSVGDIINFQNIDYYVVDNSDSSQNFVTLLKKDLLTYEEVISNNNGYDIINEDGIGTINYEISNINMIINNWTQNSGIRDNLLKVDGYKFRLLNDDEIDNLGHGEGKNYSGQGCTSGCSYLILSDYEWVYKEVPYWTISDNLFNRAISMSDSLNIYGYNNEYYAIRPVINLKKCAISN